MFFLSGDHYTVLLSLLHRVVTNTHFASAVVYYSFYHFCQTAHVCSTNDYIPVATRYYSLTSFVQHPRDRAAAEPQEMLDD